MQTIRTRGPRPQKPKRAVVHPLDRAKAQEVVWNHVAPLFEAMRGMEGANYVYFIGEADDGPVKIGTAKDPIARVRAMQTGNSRRLRVEYVLVGFNRLEKILHEMWEPFAICADGTRHVPGTAPRTEWFRPEIREHLFPIIATAAQAQVEHVLQADDVVQEDELTQLVRQAHVDHDRAVHQRDETRLLSKDGAGYAISRPSLIPSRRL